MSDELPEGWERTTLKDVIDNHRGGVWGAEAKGKKGYPVLRSTNMRGSKLDFTEVARCEISNDVAKDVALQAGDIIVSKSSGSPHLVGLPALFEGSPDGQMYLYSNFTMRLRPSSHRINPKYLFHFLSGAKAEQDRRSMSQDTSGLRNLKTGEYLAQPLPLPPLPEQQRIVEKIEKLFDESRTAREALDAVPSLLKRFRQSVLAKAFRGELVEHDPNDEPASVLLERIKAERKVRSGDSSTVARTKGKKYVEPAPIDTSELPQLPEGWEWVSFDGLLDELKNGYFSKTPEFEPPGIPILRISALRPRLVNFGELRYLREEMKKVSHYQLRNGDLLFTRYNGNLDLVGVCGMVRGLQVPIIYPDKLIRARIFSEYVLPEYLEIYFSTQVPRDIIEGKAKSSAGQQGISGKDLKNVPVALAPLAEQRRIVAKIESLFAQAEAIEQAVEVARRRAEQIDQAILARAFRGGM